MPKINKRFAITDPNRPPITAEDTLVCINQLKDHCGKPYTTVYQAMAHRNAPAPRINNSGYCLWDRDEAFAYLAARGGWKIPKVK